MNNLKKSSIPSWIKNSEVYKNKAYKNCKLEDIPLYELKICDDEDLDNILKTLEFWKVESPLPREIWIYILSVNCNREILKNSPYFYAKYLSKFLLLMLGILASIDMNEIEYFKYAIEKFDIRTQWREEGIILEKGRLEFLIYLHENEKLKTSFNECQRFCAAKGQLECLKYLVEVSNTMNPHALTFAARNGHIECLKYLSNFFPSSHEIWGLGRFVYNELYFGWWLEDIIKNGHLNCLSFIRKKGVCVSFVFSPKFSLLLVKVVVSSMH